MKRVPKISKTLKNDLEIETHKFHSLPSILSVVFDILLTPVLILLAHL